MYPGPRGGVTMSGGTSHVPELHLVQARACKNINVVSVFVRGLWPDGL